MEKAFLLIEPGFRLYKEPILKDLVSASDLKVIVATGLSDKVASEWAKKYSDFWITFTYGDDSKSANEIISKCASSGFQIVGVATYIQTSVNLVNEIQHLVNAPVLSKLRNFSLRNKGAIREKLKQRGIKQGSFHLISSIKDLESLPYKFKKPMIVKPSDMMASLAVRKVSGREAAKKAFELARSADFIGEDLRELYGNLSSAVVLEDYIEGPEYSVETCVINSEVFILGITEKKVSSDGYFSELGHKFPARMAKTIRERVRQLVVETHSALELHNTVTHTEVRVMNGIPYIIEINCRVAGGLITEIIKKSNGLSLGKILFYLHAGRIDKLKALLEKSSRRKAFPYSISFVSTKNQGRVVDIQKSRQWNSGFKSYVSVGDIIYRGELTGESRLGHVLVRGNVKESVLRSIERQFLVQPMISKSRLENDEIFVFQSLSMDALSLFQLEESVWDKRHRAPLKTIRRRLKLWKDHSFIAVSLNSQKVVGSLFMVSGRESLISKPFKPWKYFADIASKPRTFGKAKAAYIISVSSAESAPVGTATTLLISSIAELRRRRIREVAYGIRLQGLKRSGLGPLEYVEKLKTGLVKENIFRAASIAGGKPLELVENYYDDPDSLNYGLIIYHGERF